MSNNIILLIEDDIVDVMTVKRALKELKIENQLVIAGNGEEARKLLAEIDKPFIILLDLNMPRMNGLEFLKFIKNDINYKIIPTIVFTTSKDKQDILDSYSIGVQGYVIKPIDYMNFVETLKIIYMYWNICILPD